MKKLTPPALTLLFCMLFSTLIAQIVETIEGPSGRINNGLVLDKNGNIYASDLFGSGFNGTQVHKITPEGDSEIYGSGLSQPAGLAFDSSGLLYVAEFSDGEISTINDQGVVTLFASGLSQPADLAFDESGNLFVTNYGNGRVSKITPDGNVSNFATGLSQPVGLTFDDNEQLYAVSLNTGQIHRIEPNGDLVLVATLEEGPVGFMTFAFGNLYVTSTGSHLIYQVTLSGEVSIFAGTGNAGTIDGPASSAQFTNPDGIAATLSGDTLYVSENNTNLLRRILLGTPTGILDEADQATAAFMLKHNYPNPFHAKTIISYQLAKPTFVNLSVYDVNGQLVENLVNEYNNAGLYSTEWDANAASAGVYYYRIETSENKETKKCILFK